MAKALVLIEELMFASRVRESLQGAGIEVEVCAHAQAVARLQAAGADVVIFDLSDAAADGVQAATSLAQRGLLGNVRTVGVYAHVEAGVRERAQQAGFDLVVPRSRMAREGAQLVSGLLAARERPANVQDEG